MFAADMGTGKSRMAIGVMEYFGADRVVILGPHKAIRVWPLELAKHSSREWIVCNHGGRKRGGGFRPSPSTKQRVEAATEALAKAAQSDRPVIVAVNFESAWREPMRTFLLDREWDILVADESHRLKSPGGKQSKFTETLSSRCNRRLALTGTPRPHNESDLFGQARFLDAGIFGTSHADFIKRYFKMGGFEDREIKGFIDEARKEEFIASFASFAYVCDSVDVLDLPPEQDLPPMVCTLEPKARKHYDELEKEFVTWVTEDPEDDPVSAANALAKLIRLAQVSSGHLPVESDGERRIEVIGEEKKKLFNDVLEDLPEGEPVVVFCRFTHDLDNIKAVAEKRGLRYGEISGRRSDGLGQTESGEQLGTMAPGLDVVGVNEAAGGVGVDLTAARYCVFYSLSHNLGNHLQARARVHRPGATRPVFYIYLVVDGTIDWAVLRALQERKEVLNAVLQEVKQRGSTAREEVAT
jgi:SNF2 family DNA or RNA helicase